MPMGYGLQSNNTYWLSFLVILLDYWHVSRTFSCMQYFSSSRFFPCVFLEAADSVLFLAWFHSSCQLESFRRVWCRRVLPRLCDLQMHRLARRADTLSSSPRVHFDGTFVNKAFNHHVLKFRVSPSATGKPSLVYIRHCLVHYDAIYNSFQKI
jgi:hypothetical protein